MTERGPSRLTTFGEFLRYLRRRMQLTQGELAIALDCSTTLITRLEKGERLPDLALVKSAYIRALGLEREPELAARLIELAAAARYGPRVLHTAPRHNLPIQTTSFIGRERELNDLTHLLSLGSTRLLTLTGSGGVGKTRLALQLADGITQVYPDGVWLVELAPLADPALVPHAVAAVLGVREEPGRPMLATLVDHAKNRDLLLLLDNCEHLIEAVARLTEALLHECRRVCILTTSRESLGIPGEQVWRVPTLQTPDLHQQLGLVELAQVEAVRLFDERATLVLPGFVLTAENAPVVRQISIRLDGIPLAIELAAARVKVMSVEDIAARLGDRFRLLTDGSRTALPRQQTLRKVVDWSYDLLSARERTLFRRLAVFAGGWTLEAAEAVCGGEGIDPSDVLDLLARLVDKSLVVTNSNAGGVAGLTRFHFLEALHQYALERLVEAGEEVRVRERHLVYFIALGEAVALEWANPAFMDAASQARRLDLDFENVRYVQNWAAETGRVDAAVRLIKAFWTTLFVVRAVDLELRRWLQRLVAHPTAHGTAQLGWAYLLIWELYFGQDAFEQAHAANEQAREIGFALGDPAILARADYQRALQAQECGDYALARSIFDRLRGVDEQMPNDWSWIYGVLSLYEGDYPQARDHQLEWYTQLHARTSNKAHTAGSGRLLGYALAYLGDYAGAAPLLRDSLLDNRELGDNRAVAASLAACGALALAQSQWPRAARLLGAAEYLIESIHDFLQYFDRILFRRSVATLRERLDAETLSVEWAAGRAMTEEQAVSFALDGLQRKQVSIADRER